jgi:hypothetical protein
MKTDFAGNFPKTYLYPFKIQKQISTRHDSLLRQPILQNLRSPDHLGPIQRGRGKKVLIHRYFKFPCNQRRYFTFASLSPYMHVIIHCLVRPFTLQDNLHFIMTKNRKIEVQKVEVTISDFQGEDYICLTDMAKARTDDARAADVIKNWIRTRTTLEFLGTWEKIYNPDFKVVEFDHFKSQAGLPSFVLSPSQ